MYLKSSVVNGPMYNNITSVFTYRINLAHSQDKINAFC